MLAPPSFIRKITHFSRWLHTDVNCSCTKILYCLLIIIGKFAVAISRLNTLNISLHKLNKIILSLFTK